MGGAILVVAYCNQIVVSGAYKIPIFQVRKLEGTGEVKLFVSRPGYQHTM